MKYIFKHFQTLGWLSKTFSASVFMASGKHCLYILVEAVGKQSVTKQIFANH